jgi:hypothetical protein
VPRAARQGLARAWSVAFHEHPSAPDGVIYPSRLNGQTNIAVYDRVIGKLRTMKIIPLLEASELPSVLDDLLVALIDSA